MVALSYFAETINTCRNKSMTQSTEITFQNSVKGWIIADQIRHECARNESKTSTERLCKSICRLILTYGSES